MCLEQYIQPKKLDEIYKNINFLKSLSQTLSYDEIKNHLSGIINEHKGEYFNRLNLLDISFDGVLFSMGELIDGKADFNKDSFLEIDHNSFCWVGTVGEFLEKFNNIKERENDV